jgi:N-ethylmaleimide reductase
VTIESVLKVVISRSEQSDRPYGAVFLASPDLARGAPFNTPHRETFYGGAERGYTDYPFLAESDIA